MRQQNKQYLSSSLSGSDAFCFLSNLTADDRSSLEEQLANQWSMAQRKQPGHRLRALREIPLSLPWGDKAALSFFNRFIETFGEEELEAIVQQAYQDLQRWQLDQHSLSRIDFTPGTNTYITDVLKLIAGTLEGDSRFYWGDGAYERALKAFLTDSCSRSILD